MSAAIPQLLTHMQTRLAAINGTGSYVNDLSATDAVVVGMPSGAGDVHIYPSVFIVDIETTTEPGPQHTQWRHTASFTLAGFVAADDDTNEALLRAAWVLASDVHRTMTADRNPTITGGLVEDVRVQSDAVVPGAGSAYHGVGVMSARIDIIYRGDL